MIGAIIGDIIGSPYEFDQNNIKTTKFPLFNKRSHFTDDTVMTLAVAEALMNAYGDAEETEKELIRKMQYYGRKYPYAGYGEMFGRWIYEKNPMPYDSFGNGSAMRVSPVAWLYDDLSTVERFAAITSKVTHDHPEGIKGAQAIAAAIYLARKHYSKDDIRRYISGKYGYNFDRTCDEIRPTYRHVESCQETVPEALTAFFEGNSFKEVIRLAVSLGGDSDTLTAIAGSVAEAYYQIPNRILRKTLRRLDEDQLTIVFRFYRFINARES
jgi:ADP-ribosylglycohydrolase